MRPPLFSYALIRTLTNIYISPIICMDASFSAAQESGRNMEEKDCGDTPLLKAAKAGHTPVVRYLAVRREGGRGKGEGDRDTTGMGPRDGK